MAELWIQFSAGRRGAGSIDCLRCGERIHEHVEGSGEWFDGDGSATGLDLSSQTPLHEHKPAKEDGPTLGPFEHGYVQLTYDRLTHESEAIASWDKRRGDWIIEEPWTGAGEAYSDITIMVKEA